MGKAFGVVLTLLVLVFAQAGSAAEGRVIGTVAFRDGGVVPGGAMLRVVLIDVSHGADSPLGVLGETRLPVPGAPPYHFGIAYDTAAIRPSGTYVLRAELAAEGNVLFRSRGLLRVLTRGGKTEPRLWLARAAASNASIREANLHLPVSFGGELPCRDCEEIRYRLNLWADHVFYLRRVWEGKEMRRDAIGRWSFDSSTQRLTLSGGDEDLQFDVLGPEQLRLVTKTGPSPRGDDILTASPTFQEFEPHLALRGMVTWAGDHATFAECETGRVFPLAEDGDYKSLEHAYLAAAVEPGSPVMASFDGAIVRELSGGTGESEVLVERFDGIWPGETCERAASPVSLRNTYWRILRLGESEIGSGPDRREPSLILRDGEPRFTATVGCNQLTGSFAQSSDRLKFAPVAAGPVACPPPLDEWEQKLGTVLSETAEWRIKGQSLQLLNAGGEQVALLQAVYLY